MTKQELIDLLLQDDLTDFQDRTFPEAEVPDEVIDPDSALIACGVFAREQLRIYNATLAGMRPVDIYRNIGNHNNANNALFMSIVNDNQVVGGAKPQTILEAIDTPGQLYEHGDRGFLTNVLVGDDWLSFDLPDDYSSIMSMIDATWSAFWEWVSESVSPSEEGARGLPAVIVALPAIKAKMTFIATVAGALLPILSAMKGPVARILYFLGSIQKYRLLYQIVEKLLSDYFEDEPTPVDLEPITEQLTAINTMLQKGLLYGEQQSILHQALLVTLPEEENASLLKHGLTFFDVEDGKRKGVLERGLLKQITEKIEGSEETRTVIKSLLELLQMSVEELGFIDATMNYGNFTFHVSGKAVEHA